MVEHLLIGFMAGLIAHVHYVKAVYRIKLEVDLQKSKRRTKRRERQRRKREQRTKLNNLANN